MDYKAAWEELRREVQSVIDAQQYWRDRGKETPHGAAMNQAWSNVIAYMLEAEKADNRANQPDVDAKA